MRSDVYERVYTILLIFRIATQSYVFRYQIGLQRNKKYYRDKKSTIFNTRSSSFGKFFVDSNIYRTQKLSRYCRQKLLMSFGFDQNIIL